MTTKQEIADLLEQAADLLETEGWCQMTLRNPEGARCAVGALHKISGNTRLKRAAQEWLAMRLNIFALANMYVGAQLVLWNDSPGRTIDEVIDLFKETAKDLRNEAL